MMNIYASFSRWLSEKWYWNAELTTELARANELPDNVIYLDFKATHGAKEGACERRS